MSIYQFNMEIERKNKEMERQNLNAIISSISEGIAQQEKQIYRQQELDYRQQQRDYTLASQGITPGSTPEQVYTQQQQIKQQEIDLRNENRRQQELDDAVSWAARSGVNVGSPIEGESVSSYWLRIGREASLMSKSKDKKEAAESLYLKALQVGIDVKPGLSAGEYAKAIGDYNKEQEQKKLFAKTQEFVSKEQLKLSEAQQKEYNKMRETFIKMETTQQKINANDETVTLFDDNGMVTAAELSRAHQAEIARDITTAEVNTIRVFLDKIRTKVEEFRGKTDKELLAMGKNELLNRYFAGNNTSISSKIQKWKSGQ